MSFLRQFKIGLFILFGIQAQTHATQLESLIQKNILTREAALALQNISQNGFIVSVLVSNSVPQKSVILVGEKHLCKTHNEESLGLEARAHFALRGAEGVECTGPCGSIIERTVCSVFTCCTGLVEKVTGTGSLTDENRTPESGDHTHKHIWLETGHNVDCAERLTYGECITSCVGILGWAVTYGIPAVPEAVSTALIYTSAGTTGCLFLGCGVPIAEAFLPQSFPTSCLRWIGMGGIIGSRNETMVANIEKALDQNPQYSSIFVVAGMFHIPGMRKLLISKGYERVSLEGESMRHFEPESENRLPENQRMR